MKDYKIILFDLDDTLVDDFENIKYGFKKMEEYLNNEYTEERFKKWYLFDKDFWTDFYNGKFEIPYDKDDKRFVSYVQSLRYKIFYQNEFDMEKSLKINKLYLNSLKEVAFPIDGAYETLEYLAKKYTLVIATNGPSEAVESKLSKINCLQFFKHVFSSDMTKNKVPKPSAIFFDELLEYINYNDRKKVLIIGDSLKSEVQGGMNSNIDTCWFNKNNEELPKEYKPTMTITSLKELIKEL